MTISRNNESDSEKCKEISYMYKRYNVLVDKLIHSENGGEIDTLELKRILLEMQNFIHDDLISLAVMEGGVNA